MIMKLLHISSFKGNIGDLISHEGTYELFKQILTPNYFVTQKEIRKTYMDYFHSDKWAFDSEFVDEVNTFDLTVIGGGNFLDYWISESNTATTVNLDKKNVQKITKPLLFMSIGSMPKYSITQKNIFDYSRFMDLLNEKKIFVGLRNDGSKDIMRDNLKLDNWSNIYDVLDSAFFYPIHKVLSNEKSKKYILINTTLDQLEFSNRLIRSYSASIYKEQLKLVIEYILDETDYDILFVPHIHQDLKAINEIIDDLDKYYVKFRIIIHGVYHSKDQINSFLGLYKDATHIIAMRYHSNISALILNKSLSSIIAQDRVYSLIKKIDKKLMVKIDQNMATNIISHIKKGNRSTKVSEYILKHKEITIKNYQIMFQLNGLKVNLND